MPFDDASGERLRSSMGVTREQFDDAEQVTVLPMGSCYPDSGRSGVLPLPHPSPRNNGWLRHNPWFEADVVPALRLRIADVLASAA